MESRRGLLAGISGALTAMAGCSMVSPLRGGSANSLDGSIKEVYERPTCSDPERQLRLVIEPRGKIVYVPTRAEGQSLIEELDADLQTQFLVATSGDVGWPAVEIRSEILNPEELELALAVTREDGVDDGLAWETENRIANTVQEDLAKADEITGGTVYHHNSNAGAPIIAIITPKSDSKLSPAIDPVLYTIYEGERRQLVDRNLLEVNRRTSDVDSGVVELQFSKWGQLQFRRRLQELAAIRPEQELYIDLGEETVWSRELNRSLSSALRSEEWNGQLRIPFDSQLSATVFTQAVNLVNFPMPAKVELRSCDSGQGS